MFQQSEAVYIPVSRDVHSEGKCSKSMSVMLVMMIVLVKDSILDFYKFDIPIEMKMVVEMFGDQSSSVQYEALFLTLGFLITSIVVALADVSVTFLISSLVTSLSLLVSLTSSQASLNCFMSSLAYSLYSMVSVSALLALFQNKR